jgi:hypothetical protein
MLQSQVASRAAVPVAAARAQLAAENDKLIGALQSTALMLANIVNELNAYGAANSEKLSKAVTQVKKALQVVPFGDSLLQSDTFKYAENISQALLESSNKLRDDTKDIEQTIKELNLQALMNGILKLAEITRQLKARMANAGVATSS